MVSTVPPERDVVLPDGEAHIRSLSDHRVTEPLVWLNVEGLRLDPAFGAHSRGRAAIRYDCDQTRMSDMWLNWGSLFV